MLARVCTCIRVYSNKYVAHLEYYNVQLYKKSKQAQYNIPFNERCECSVIGRTAHVCRCHGVDGVAEGRRRCYGGGDVPVAARHT